MCIERERERDYTYTYIYLCEAGMEMLVCLRNHVKHLRWTHVTWYEAIYTPLVLTGVVRSASWYMWPSISPVQVLHFYAPLNLKGTPMGSKFFNVRIFSKYTKNGVWWYTYWMYIDRRSRCTSITTWHNSSIAFSLDNNVSWPLL